MVDKMIIENGLIIDNIKHDIGNILSVASDGSVESIDPTTIEASGSKLQSDVIADIEVGSIEMGDIIPEGTDLDGFVRQLFSKTYFPTFVVPSASLTSSLSSNVESGTISNVTLTMNFNRGSIVGNIVGGIWNPSAIQDNRSGPATNYIIDGVSTGTNNNRTLNNYQVVDGSNSWSSTVSYSEGPQPIDSVGDNYLTPLVAGNLIRNVTVNGRRNAFYGVDSTTNTPYTLSSEIRSLSGTQLNPSNGTSFTISIPIGSEMVVFAYPATLRDVFTVKYVEGLNAEVRDIFNLTNITVEGANGYTAISYKVYTYIPVEPFSSTATYNVTI